MQHEGFPEADQPPPPVTRERGRLGKRFLDAILSSKRVGASIASILVGILGQYGMDESLAMAIQATLISWIVSDSVRPTENVLTSRRFWLVVCSILASAAARYGFNLDPEMLMTIVIPIVGWILGDGIRETLSGANKELQVRLKAR